MTIRKMFKKDISDVAKLDSRNYPFKYAYDEHRVAAYLFAAASLCFVVENGDKKVVGYCIASMKNTKIVLHRLVIDSGVRRKKLGTSLINLLKDRCTKSRDFIEHSIIETNLEGQLFLKSLGFEAVEVRKEDWDQHDGYIMEWVKDEF